MLFTIIALLEKYSEIGYLYNNRRTWRIIIVLIDHNKILIFLKYLNEKLLRLPNYCP